jgi:hypothetical protein
MTQDVIRREAARRIDVRKWTGVVIRGRWRDRKARAAGRAGVPPCENRAIPQSAVVAALPRVHRSGSLVSRSGALRQARNDNDVGGSHGFVIDACAIH